MRYNRIGSIVAIGIVSMLVSSCDGAARPAPTEGFDSGSSDGGLDPGPSISGPDTTTFRGAPGPGSPGGGSGAGSSDGGFAWVPFGPVDPQSPVPGDWPQYNLLAQHQCGDLMQDGNGRTGDQLWRALTALCTAVVAGDQAQWNVVRTAFASAGGAHFSEPCLENAVRALLKRALDWRKNHPNGRPTVHFPVAATETECGKRSPNRNGGLSEPTTSSTPSPSNDSSQPGESNATAPSR
jgi:hypothetical protein